MIEILKKTDEKIDEREFYQLEAFVFPRLHLEKAVELSISLVDEKTMEALHLQWMDLPGPTDVLSFPMDQLQVGTAEKPVQNGVLGDIVLCPGVTREQAKKAGHSHRKENVLLFIHGLLHLLGYDHVDLEEKKEMFDLQNALLNDYLELYPDE